MVCSFPTNGRGESTINKNRLGLFESLDLSIINDFVILYKPLTFQWALLWAYWSEGLNSTDISPPPKTIQPLAGYEWPNTPTHASKEQNDIAYCFISTAS